MAADQRAPYVAWCLSQLGAGPLDKYFEACGIDQWSHPSQWCGIFALAGLVGTGLCSWPWSFAAGKPGFVWRLPKTTLALAKGGDVAVQNRSPWHHCVLRTRTSTGWLVINGNGKGGVVTETESVLANYTVYSIQPLVDDAESVAPTDAPPPLARELPASIEAALTQLRAAIADELAKR
jgi:hypothetical protein